MIDNELPYGDFIIYHEMLKFIKEHPEDILFITRDITKSDWIKIDNSQSLSDYITRELLSREFSSVFPQESDTESDYLRDITPERFISELQTAIKWAGTYGNKYVNENLFIYDILKSKRFRFATSRRVLDELINNGIVDRKMEAHDDKTIPCLSLTKTLRKVK